jgi:hypothetical protein
MVYKLQPKRFELASFEKERKGFIDSFPFLPTSSLTFRLDYSLGGRSSPLPENSRCVLRTIPALEKLWFWYLL